MAKSKYPGIKLLNEIGTKKDIAAAYGVSERTIYRWQNKAKAESCERQQYPGAKAISKFNAPVEIASTFIDLYSPSFITEPFPNCFSIWLIAASNAFFFSVFSLIIFPP